jgi:hypothetical protein
MDKKKTWILSGISLLVHFFLSAPDSFSSSQLRVGSLESGNKKFILIGINSKVGNPISNFNFEHLGFEGSDLGEVDPKFLLEISNSPSPETKVYSFEVKGSESSHFSLPLLISTKSVKTEEYLHASANMMAGLGKTIGLGIGAATAAGRFPTKEHEDRLRTQAAYLLELIFQYREFPEWLNAMDHTHPERAQRILFDLGGALITRYNPKSNWAGLHVPGEDRALFFEQWMNQTQENRGRNKGVLHSLANEYRLKLFNMGNAVSFVYIDPKVHDLENPASDFLDASKGKPHREGPSTPLSSADHSQFLPGCLIAFTQKLGSVNLLNFNFPGAIAREMRQLRGHRLAREIAGGFVPLSYWLLKGVHKVIEDKALESNNSRYISRKEAYGSVLALAETQALETTSASQMDLEPYRLAVKSYSLSARVENIYDALAYLIREEDRQGYLTHQLTREELKQIKASHYSSLERELKKHIPPSSPNTPEQQNLQASERKNSSRASRGPASLTSWFKPSPPAPERNPLIVIMIDGLRPDRFKIAAQEGLIPNLSSLFYERGTEVESFTPRSLTLPSWSTILTGFESDVHGIRSNAPTSRIEMGITDNYLNPVKDLFEAKNWKKNRAFQRIEEDQTGEPGKVWFPAYFGKKQSLYNYIPVVNGASKPASKLIQTFFSHLSAYYNDSWFPPSSLDLASAQNTARLINADRKGNLRLVMNWYSAVDEAQHYNNHLLPLVMKEVDQAVGVLLTAARKHPALKNATVVLISDHGHTGGFDAFCEHSPLFKASEGTKTSSSGPLVANTSFNLTHFLSGSFRGFEHLQFKVATPSPSETQPDLSWMGEFYMPALHLNYKKLLEREAPTALIDASGSSLAQIYLKGQTEWKKRLSFYELTHFILPLNKLRTNLIEDFFNARVSNLMVSDDDLLGRLSDLTQHHPVQLIAVPLERNENISQIEKWGAGPETGTSSREPVVVLAQDPVSRAVKSGIIFTRSDLEGRDWFRYVVVKDFEQEASGRYRGTPSQDPHDDPLQYLGQVPTTEITSSWRTDHEWLRLAQHHHFPTAIFSLARTLTLAPKFMSISATPGLSETVKAARRSEIPDLALLSNPGFGFHSHAPMESDHGGLSYEEVRNSFFISSLNPALFREHKEVHHPVLTRDYAATFLEYAGMGGLESGRDPLPPTQGESFKVLIDTENLPGSSK